MPSTCLGQPTRLSSKCLTRKWVIAKKAKDDRSGIEARNLMSRYHVVSIWLRTRPIVPYHRIIDQCDRASTVYVFSRVRRDGTGDIVGTEVVTNGPLLDEVRDGREAFAFACSSIVGNGSIVSAVESE